VLISAGVVANATVNEFSAEIAGVANGADQIRAIASEVDLANANFMALLLLSVLGAREVQRVKLAPYWYADFSDTCEPMRLDLGPPLVVTLICRAVLKPCATEHQSELGCLLLAAC
jgi:hypothetical protein